MSRKHNRGLVSQGPIWVQGLLYFVLYTKQICLMYKALCTPNYIYFNQINLQTICLSYFSFISRFCYLKGYNFLPILSYLHLQVCILPTVMYKNTILGLKIFWLIVYMWNLSFYLCVCVRLHIQSCPTLLLPELYRLICLWNSPARILEWVAISFSRGSSWPQDWTHVSCISCIGRWVLYQLSHLGSPCRVKNVNWPFWNRFQRCGF